MEMYLKVSALFYHQFISNSFMWHCQKFVRLRLREGLHISLNLNFSYFRFLISSIIQWPRDMLYITLPPPSFFYLRFHINIHISCHFYYYSYPPVGGLDIGAKDENDIELMNHKTHNNVS